MIQDGSDSATSLLRHLCSPTPQVKVTIEQGLLGNLSPEDWADLRELLSADGTQMGPEPLIGTPKTVNQSVLETISLFVNYISELRT
jgi:hypothetical protein